MKKYLKSLKIEYLNSKEYFVSFVSSIFYIPITIIVYYFLWKFIMKGQADIAGMNFDDVIAYFITILVVKNSISNTMAETYYIFQDINSGNIDTLITSCNINAFGDSFLDSSSVVLRQIFICITWIFYNILVFGILLDVSSVVHFRVTNILVKICT